MPSKTETLKAAILKYANELDAASDADELETLSAELDDVLDQVNEMIDNYADDEE